MSSVITPDVKHFGGGIQKDQVGARTAKYVDYFAEDAAKDGTELTAKRLANYQDVVNSYYDLATSFYEFGWGDSFHFAHRFRDESLKESIRRHEYFLALKLHLSKADKVLDVGCGIGGPLRAISGFSGASVVGVNNNSYQISRGQALNAKTGHHDHCSFLKADFMKVPEADATFDAAYQLEATCHAPDLVGCYREIYRLLKPGGSFASCDWVMTDSFNAANPEHVQCKEDICLGNGLPDLRRNTDTVAALKKAGFIVEEAYDLGEKSDIPWYDPIDKDRPLSLKNLSGFRTTRVGRTVTHYAVTALEYLRLAPPGSTTVSSFLVKGADALVAGGRKGIFTPMFFTLARKPE